MQQIPRDDSGGSDQGSDSGGSNTSTDNGGNDTGSDTGNQPSDTADHQPSDSGGSDTGDQSGNGSDTGNQPGDTGDHQSSNNGGSDTGNQPSDTNNHPSTDNGNQSGSTDNGNQVPFHKLGGDQGQSQETQKNQQDDSTNTDEAQRRVLYFGFAAGCMAAIVAAPSGNVGAAVAGSVACEKLFREAGGQAGALLNCFGKYGGLSASGLESGLKTCVLNFAP
ncbi:hypothetical protein [Streptomyces sp. 900105245]